MPDAYVPARRRRLVAVSLVLTTAGPIGCIDPEPEPRPFSLRFAATADDQPVGCSDRLTGVGPDGQHRMGISDLRFYVSNLQMYDASGALVPLSLDDSEFQYANASGQVSLVDLTSNSEGSCANTAIAFAEGTARTNDVITGSTLTDEVVRITFDVGVPQTLMKETIATNTAEAAPSPLDEMYWSWTTGYRHLVLNFSVEDGAGERGDGYLHVGSRDCGAEGTLALEDREACGFVNTPAVALDDFDLETDTVTLDVPALVRGLDFIAPIYDPMTFEVIDEGPGVECHSSPDQPDCAMIFGHLGLDASTGSASPSSNEVFMVR